MKQRGYSLVEVVLATLVMLSCLAVAGSILTKFVRAFSLAEEVSQTNTDADFVTNLIKKDFENLGRNLTRQVNEPFAGKVVKPFFANSNYLINPDLIEKNTGNSFLRSQLSFRGTSRVSGHCSYCTIDLVEGKFEALEDNAEFISSSGTSALADTQLRGDLTHRIFTFNSNDPANFLPFEILISRVADSNCVATVTFNGLSQQLPISCLQFQTIGLKTETQIRNLEIESGEMSYFKSSLDEPYLSIPFPIYTAAESRPSPFLNLNSDGFLLFSGSETTPKILRSNVRPSLSSSFIIEIDNTDNLSINDYLLLTDFANSRSCLVQIENIISASVITVKRAENSSFLYFSQAEDYFDTNQGLPFLTGSKLVKLASIEYRINNLSSTNQTALFRRSLDRNWEMVLPNVSNISVIPSVENQKTSFQISLTLTNEGFETDTVNKKLTLNISPRPLNSIFEVQ